MNLENLTPMRKRRIESRITLEALGDVVGMNAATLSKIENGKIFPLNDQAERIADALQCEKQDLWDDEQIRVPRGKCSKCGRMF